MRKNNIIITIDYETWQPIPDGEIIDWDKDIILPTKKLIKACESSSAKLTLMVEICELMYLEEKEPDVYNRIVEQIQSVVKAGHDVQLHVHPNWLPELGAVKTENSYKWDMDKASCDNVPGDLSVFIRRCKDALEKIVRPVRPEYRVRAFRAGAYRVQPFARLGQALIENDIPIEMSVYAGGRSLDRGYNFTKCKSVNQPFRASLEDPQIEVDRGERSICELPISVFRKSERLFIDGDESALVARRLLSMPRRAFENESNWFVITGHTKGERDYNGIREQLEIIGKLPNTQFTTISESVDSILNDAEVNKKQKKDVKEISGIINSIYNDVRPGDGSEAKWAGDVLRVGRSLCGGYAWINATIMNRYGYHVRWYTVFAKDMPRGRGEKRIDTHELLEVGGYKRAVVDPTLNIIYNHSLRKLCDKTELADVSRQTHDDRFIKHEYGSYTTSAFFGRIFRCKKNDLPYVESDRGFAYRTLRRIIDWSLQNVQSVFSEW